MPGSWPARWNLDPVKVRSVVVLAGTDALADVDCVAIVPDSLNRHGANYGQLISFLVLR